MTTQDFCTSAGLVAVGVRSNSAFPFQVEYQINEAVRTDTVNVLHCESLYLLAEFFKKISNYRSLRLGTRTRFLHEKSISD